MYFPCCPDEAPGRPCLAADISIFGDSDTTTNSDTRTGGDAKQVIQICAPKSYTVPLIILGLLKLKKLILNKVIREPTQLLMNPAQSSFQCSHLVSQYCYQQLSAKTGSPFPCYSPIYKNGLELQLWAFIIICYQSISTRGPHQRKECPTAHFNVCAQFPDIVISGTLLLQPTVETNVPAL